MPLHRRLSSFSKFIQQAVAAASFLAVGLIGFRVIKVSVLQISIFINEQASSLLLLF